VRPPVRFLVGLMVLVGLVWASPGGAAASAFNNWAAVVIAGDYRAHGGAPSEVFDNARRDLVKALIAKGFSPDHIGQFSVRPERYPKDGVLKSGLPVVQGLRSLAAAAPGGCLIYLTSHGSPEGVVVADRTWTPNMMSALIDDTCGQRPTVVVISACFSGVFVPVLADANRMVLTAARPDRTSFGCGEADRYTYFDGCVLQEIGAAHDFAGLGRSVQACVAQRERETKAAPPSEPQLDIGAALRPMLPLYAFSSPPNSSSPNSSSP
jgi:hypothetical protein